MLTDQERRTRREGWLVGLLYILIGVVGVPLCIMEVHQDPLHQGFPGIIFALMADTLLVAVALWAIAIGLMPFVWDD